MLAKLLVPVLGGRLADRSGRYPRWLNAFERLDKQALRLCHWLYLVWAIPLIFFLATVQPPFSAPDEWAHFGRAYMLSRAEVWPAVTSDGLTAGHLDAAMCPLIGMLHENRRKPFVTVEPDFRAARWGGTQTILSFNQASFFPPVYLPQTFAVLAARVADLSIRRASLLSALVTGLVCVALSALAIRIAA